jgi:hypothetical protein
MPTFSPERYKPTERPKEELVKCFELLGLADKVFIE